MVGDHESVESLACAEVRVNTVFRVWKEEFENLLEELQKKDIVEAIGRGP